MIYAFLLPFRREVINMLNNSFALFVEEMNNIVEKHDKNTPIEYLSYQDIDSLELDNRTEQANYIYY